MLRDVDDCSGDRPDRPARAARAAAPGWRWAWAWPAAASGDSGGGSKEDTEKVVKTKVDGDLVYFNWSEYLDPDADQGVREAVRGQGAPVELRLDVVDDGQAALGQSLRRDLPDRRVRAAPDRRQPAAEDRPRQAEELRTSSTEFFHDPGYDPGSAHTTPYTMYATGLGYRADKIRDMTGSWRRPLPARPPERQDLHARRLPGGHRHGQPA